MAQMTYTYEEFLNKAQTSGLLNSFSQADLSLALKNPDAGMTILSYKQDYQNAVSDEARALANAGAEYIRSTYGGYTAGSSGSGYYLNESQAVGQSSVEGSGYVNQYADEQRDIIQNLGQSGAGDYVAAAEEAWESYRKAYLREGQRAYQDSLGAAAANTGGVASTAAVAAAQQAQNYYAAQAADKKGELYQQAFENQLAARNQALAELGMYDQLNSTAYGQYQSEAERALQSQQFNASLNQADERFWAELNQNNQQFDASLSQANAQFLAELEQQKQQFQAEQKQQSYNNALTKWQAYGYVTADIAEVLGLPAGTAYTEQAYNAWYQAFQEASNGVYTGKVMSDTVNASTEKESAAENPAKGDSPQNHQQVSQGSSGSDVTALQTYLIHLGYHCGDKGADGVFGTDTRAAVKAFQADYGLTVDGICGSKTWRAIFVALNS